MKALRFITANILLLCSVFSFAQSKLADSPRQSSQIHIYKIDKEDLRKIHLKEDGFRQEMLKTIVAKYNVAEKMPTLPRGNYVKVNVVENQLNYTELIIDDLYAKIIPSNKFVVCLYDSLGNIISNAEVKKGSLKLKFDKETQTYSTNKAKNNQIVEIAHHGVYHFLKVENYQYYNHQNNIFRTTWWKMKSLWYETKSSVKGIFYPSERPIKQKYTGFIVFDKPIYKPGETVKLKGYISDKNGKRYNKPIAIRLSGSRYSSYIDTVLTQLEPYSPGLYNYEFKLSQELDLMLDKNYSILFSTDNKKSYAITNYFRYEDYELKGINFSVTSAKTEFAIGDSIKLKLKVADENGMGVYDGKVEVLVTPGSFDENKMKRMETIFIPDTLYNHTVDMFGVSEKDFIIPDSIFPLGADIKLNVKCTYLSADNEKHTEYLYLSKLNKKYTLDFSLNKGMLSIKELCQGESLASIAKISIDGAEGESLYCDTVKLPHTLAIPWLTKNILVETKNTKEYYIFNEAEKEQLGYQFYRANDSIYLKVDNPANIPFWYTIRKMNNEIAKGYTKALDYAIKDTGQDGYNMQLAYLFLGTNKYIENSLPFVQKNITMDVTTPTTVYPGQKANVQITVTDKKGEPVKDADITAYSFTSKFKGYSMPNIPIGGKARYAKQVFNARYNIDDDLHYSSKSDMTWSKWAAAMALDTIEFYKFLYPEAFYVYSEPTTDKSTQLSPFVVINGEVQGIHMLWIDERLYYVKQAEQLDVYSFKIKPGNHRLRFRTHNREVLALNFYVEEGTKNIMSFNAGKPYIRIPYNDPKSTPFVLTSRLLHKKEQGYMSQKEETELRTQLITVNNTFGKIELPNVHQTIEIPGYIATGNTLYYLNHVPRTTYNNTLRAQVNSPILAGPFPQRSFMNGLPNIATVYAGNHLLANTQLEGGNLYTLYPNYQKIKQWDKSVINRTIPAFRPTLNFKQQLLTKKDIEKQVESNIENVLRSAYGIADIKPYSMKYNAKRFKLNLTLGQDSTGTKIAPTLIFIEPLKQEDRKDYQLYYGATRDFNSLPTEELTIHLVFNDSTSYSHPVKLYSGGKTYLKLDAICYQKNSEIAKTAYNLLNRGGKKSYVENPYISAPIKDSLILSSLFDEGKFNKENKNRKVVTGVVRDNQGPIIGAVVKIKGTNNAAMTNFDGEFEIMVNGNVNLEVSYIGYKIKEINALIGHDYNIVIQEDERRLDEVMVVGYGMQKRSSLTGSMTTITNNSFHINNQILKRTIPGAMQGAMQGAMSGIMIRGINSASAASRPMIIVNGLPFNGSLEDIDTSSILSLNILKDASATSIYGAQAANGVIMIETSASNSPTATNADGGMADEVGNTMRRNFHDDAFWQPKLKTNENGEVSFEVTYPDDITNWNAYFIALGGKNQSDTKQMSIRSFKALSARLSIPRFAIRGDSLNAVGKIANHFGDSLQLTRTIELNNNKLADRIKVGNSYVDYIPVSVTEGDSITLAYTLQMENGYFDGEERSAPIFEQGLLQTYGDFIVINDSLTHVLNTDPLLGTVTVHAEASSLELFVREIDNIDRYLYMCNEQMASKLKALLAKKYIYKLQNKEFKEDKKINSLIRDLNKNKNKEGYWGWWNKSESVMWISKHIISALLDAEEAGYKTDLDKQALAWVFEQELKNGLASVPFIADRNPSFAKSELLDRLMFLKRLNAPIDYKLYLDQLNNKLKNESVKDKLKNMLVMSAIGLQDSVQLDSLMHYSSKTILGALYWEDEKKSNLQPRNFYRPNETNTENTLMAYEILKNMGGHEKEMKSIGNYFFEQRKNNTWNNIYESSRIIQTLMPDMLKNTDTYANVVMDINGNKVSEFPYTTKLEPTEEIRVSKTGTMPLFVTAYQKEWNKNPIKEKSKGFEISTTFKTNNDSIAYLREGKPAILQATLNLEGEAEYVMIEIPIPAGCTYESKLGGSYWKEAHREHYKEKVVIFCNKLAKGEHVFNVELLPRYTGKYTLNPAKAELMYFPTFYGNEEVKVTLVK